MNQTLALLATPRLQLILLLGFSSGLPLALSSGTLQAWLTVEGIDITTIGLFTLASVPYTLKFLWSPLLDRFVPPFWGRRRGWLAVSQFLLALAIGGMASLSPHESTWAMAMLALLIAFASSTQDIAFDAYRTDVLKPQERGLGAAFSVTGYRLAMLTSGALALLLGDHIGFHNTYWIMAGLMLAMMIPTALAEEPNGVVAPRTLSEAIWKPLQEFFSRPGAIALLLAIILYKVGDAFAGSLTTAFLIRGAGFSPTDVGLVNKGMGLAVTLFGAIYGGLLMARLGLVRSLLLFGALQAITNLGFWVLAQAGHVYWLMVGTIFLENFAGGMGTAAFVALLMTLCDHRYTATQFALLSALASLARVYLGPAAGYLVEHLGWAPFFLLTFFTALPGIYVIWRLRSILASYDSTGH